MTVLLNNLLRQVRPVASRHWSRAVASPIAATVLPSFLDNGFQQQQVRSITKRKKRLLKKKAEKEANAAIGIFPPKPPNYIDKNTPVINAKTREERNANAREANVEASEVLKERMEVVNAQPLLRHHMEGLVMSDRVRKLFDLTNGNQREVIKAQKKRGMELFARREGDTGSSAVQGEYRCS